MRVADIMTQDPVACDANDSALSVARAMRDKGVGFIVVLSDDRVVGVVTDRQLAVGVLAENVDPRVVRAQDVMTENPATVAPADTIFELVDTLRSAGVVRRVPVVDRERRLLGVVSISDLAVVAKDLTDAILLEDTRHSLRETKVATGGKRVHKMLLAPARAR